MNTQHDFANLPPLASSSWTSLTCFGLVSRLDKFVRHGQTACGCHTMAIAFWGGLFRVGF